MYQTFQERWSLFVKVKSLMKKVDHPHMRACFSRLQNGLQSLPISPKQIARGEAFGLDDFLRSALPQLKAQAESCLYQPNVQNHTAKTRAYQEIVERNRYAVSEIFFLLERV